MPPLFMYSSPAKSRTIVRAPPSTALTYASISAGSLLPVTSPKMATTLAVESSVERTSTRVAISGMVLASLVPAAADRQSRDNLIVFERHVVGQSGDPEDLPVVLREPSRPDLAMVSPRLREEADGRGDAGAGAL